MKKSRMPKQLKIGGFNYVVKYPYVFKNENSLVGLHEGDKNCIKLAKYFGNSERHWHKILETFMHEIIHAVDHYYCGKIMTEEETNIFSNNIFMVLRDNNLQFKENILPSSVKIGAFVYKVLFPHIYNDGEDFLCSSDNEALLFKVVDPNKDDVVLSIQSIMTNLLYLILCAICEITNIPRGFDVGKELGTNGLHFTTFANGLYQVIIDNNLEKLFKSDGELK